MWPVNVRALAAACLFCLSASAVYLMNDIIDIERDRKHPDKAQRAIAAHQISSRQAGNISLIIAIFSAIFSFILDRNFGWVIIAYLLLNLVYSLVLKKIPPADVFFLPVFYYMRLLAGSFVTGISLSYWIILLTTILALFLGLIKRKQEMHLISRVEKTPYDALILVSAFFIFIFYTLYSVSPRTLKELGTTHMLFGMPFVVLGILRYIFIIYKIGCNNDIINVIISDRIINLSIILWGIVSISVVYFGL